MNGLMKKLFVLGLLVNSSAQVMAYTWGFANHTNENIEIKLELALGPTDYNMVPAGEQRYIGWNVPNFYAGFCLGGLYYRTTASVQKYGKNAAWYEVNLMYVDNDGLNKILDSAAAIGSGIQSVGTAVGSGIASAMSGGATGMAEGAAKTAKEAKAAQIGGVSQAAGSADLGGLIKGIGVAISNSGCRGRHIDIFEDENGKFYFTTLQK